MTVARWCGPVGNDMDRQIGYSEVTGSRERNSNNLFVIEIEGVVK